LFQEKIKAQGFCRYKVCIAHIILLLSVLAASIPANGQQADTADKIKIHILNNKFVTFTHTDTGEFYRFIGDVVMQQGTDTLYCDSLIQNKTSNIIEAFGNVRIAQQDGTQGKSEYLRYTSDKKLAYMHGNVSLTDGKNNLQSPDLTYDLGTKVGNYFNGGVLHNDSTTVTSNTGIYNGRTKDARFTGDAVIIDPKYKIVSEDLEYNTETKETKFYAKSTVTSDSGKTILQTSNGTYDGKLGKAHFVGHSSVWDDGEYIEGDSLDYNKLTGYGLGNGHVISIDTAHHSTLYCGHVEYFHKARVLWATIKPVMEQVNGKDTLYLAGDTMYTAPMVKEKIVMTKGKAKTDSLQKLPTNLKSDTAGKWIDIKRINDAKSLTDTMLKASPRPMGPEPDSLYFVGYVKDSSNATKPLSDNVKDTTNLATKKNKQSSAKDTIKLKPAPDFRWVVPNGPKYRKMDTTKSITIALEAPQPERKKKRRKGIAVAEPVADTASSADTTAPMYFIAWNHVKLFSDSLQGRCDSICYTRSDSTIRMISAPIAWAHNSQITGDTILLYLDSNHLRSMYVPNNAMVVSQSGPAKAKLFDQIQGRTLTAHFKNNEITDMLVVPDAECIYYSKDEHEAYMGVNQSKSVRMHIFFEDRKIIDIKFQQDVHQTVTPLEQADLPGMKLSRFKWRIYDRPKSKEELFK